MTKEITILELESRNYDSKNITNYILHGICSICNNNFTYSSVKHFLRSRKNKQDKKDKWKTCPKCWHCVNTSLDSNWIENNRNAQFIAQNKPEQKIKNAVGVSKSWDDKRREKASIHLKNRWKNDEDFAKKAISNINWTQNKNEYYRVMMSKSIHSGGNRGIYNNIQYESCLELSYILWCLSNNISIIRFNLSPIEYLDENSKIRVYLPDFIINNNTIVEIKGLGMYYQKNIERIPLKFNALKKWCEDNSFSCIMLLSSDDILKINYKKARNIHREIKKEKNN